MAISIFASNQNNYSTNILVFDFDVPAGVVEGDIIEFYVTTTVSTATTMTPSHSTGVLLAAESETGGAVTSAGWYYRVPSTIPTKISVTFGAVRQGSIVWEVLKGVHLTTAPDVAVVPGTHNGAAAANAVMASLTTVTPGAFITGGIHMGSGSEVVTPAAPWVITQDATRRNGILAQRGAMATPGATGTSTWTFAAGQYKARIFQVAWRPAESAPPPLAVTASVVSDPFPSFSGDVADGAAIVYDSVTPANSVVIGTNKGTGGGLYVFNLSGDILSSSLLGPANSVDTRDLTGVAGWDDRLLVMTSDRTAGVLRFYWMNRTTKALTSAGTSAALGWEPYGTCLYKHSDGTVYAFVTQRGPDDTSPRNMYQYPLTRSGESVTMGAAVRTIGLTSVVEGLAADDSTGKLYASQEDVGLYQYSAAPTGGSTRVTIDTVGAGNLIADVEDVALAYHPDGTKLLVSSQGDNTYHVYDAVTFAHELKFTINRPGGTTQVLQTDGLDVFLGDFGSAFPNGLIVVHDGERLPVSDFAFASAEPVFGELPAGAYSDDLTNSGTGSNAATDKLTASVAVAPGGSGSQAVSEVLSTSDAPTASSSGTGAVTGTLTASQAVAMTGSGASVIDDEDFFADAVSTTSTGTNAVTYQVAAVDALLNGSTGNIQVVDEFALEDDVTSSGSGQAGVTATLAAQEAVSSSGTGTIAAADLFSQVDDLEQSGAGQAVTSGTLAASLTSTPSGSGQSDASGALAGVEESFSAGSGGTNLLDSVVATASLGNSSGGSSTIIDTAVTTESFSTSGLGSNSVVDDYTPPVPPPNYYTLVGIEDLLTLTEVPDVLLTLTEVTNADD